MHPSLQATSPRAARPFRLVGTPVYPSTNVDFFEESLAAFVRAGNFDDALELIAASWPPLATLHGGRLREAIASVPEVTWGTNAWILAAMGASYRSLDSQSRSAALPWFRTTRALIAADRPAEHVVASILTHESVSLRSLGQFDDARELALDAWRILADDVAPTASQRIRVQAQIALQLGLTHLHGGELDDAATMLRIALGLSEKNLVLSETVECLAGLAYLEYLSGRYAAAVEFSERARDVAVGTDLIESRFGVGALIALTLIAVERCDAAAAMNFSLPIVRSSERSEWHPVAHFAEAEVAVIDGRYIEGLECVRRGLDSARTWQGEPQARVMCEIVRGELLMHLGEFAAALEALQAVAPSPDHATCPARFIAGIRYKAGDSAACLAALAECERLGETHSARTIVDVLFLKAAASYDLAQPAQADVSFDRSLLLAAATGVRRPFLLVSSVALQRMLCRAADRGQPQRVHNLLADLKANDDIPLTGSLEPLSDREVDIAQQLFEDKTVNQIASDLYISSNTVKTHVRSIYRKLSANNRRDAVRRVRELGLDPNITPTD